MRLRASTGIRQGTECSVLAGNKMDMVRLHLAAKINDNDVTSSHPRFVLLQHPPPQAVAFEASGNKSTESSVDVDRRPSFQGLMHHPGTPVTLSTDVEIVSDRDDETRPYVENISQLHISWIFKMEFAGPR